MADVSYTLKGMEYGNCNCDYGCPCQFNALPTHGDCQYIVFVKVDEGNYGDTDISGQVFVLHGKFPGAVHQGDGTQQLIVDENSTEEQRTAIRKIAYNEDSEELNTHFAVYNAMCTTVHEPIVAAIEFEADIEARTARGRVPGLITSDAEPIKNPVTGIEHRARINLPNGFEYTVAEMGSGTSKTEGLIELDFNESYAQFNELHLTEAGVVR